MYVFLNVFCILVKVIFLRVLCIDTSKYTCFNFFFNNVYVYILSMYVWMQIYMLL